MALFIKDLIVATRSVSRSDMMKPENHIIKAERDLAEICIPLNLHQHECSPC